MHEPRPLTRFAICLATGVLLLTGCQLPPLKRMPLDATAGLYERAVLTYHVDAGQLNIPLAVTRITGQGVSYEDVPSSSLANQSTGVLAIEFPHPAGREGFALATMTLNTAVPTEGAAAAKDKTEKSTGSLVREVWKLDLPTAELDAAMETLRQANFVASEPKTNPGIVISARLNGREIQKKWDPIPTFDVLMQRVRRDGQLVVYERPTQQSQSKSQAMLASVNAYRQLVARDGGGDSRHADVSHAVATSALATPTSSPTPVPAPGVAANPSAPSLR